MKRILTLFILMGCWLFALAQEKGYDFVVAEDGTGDFKTVQEAINAVPDYRKAGATRILIRKGIYKEKIIIYPYLNLCVVKSLNIMKMRKIGKKQKDFAALH